MFRALVIAASLVLVVPTLVMAQQDPKDERHKAAQPHPSGQPHPGGPPPGAAVPRPGLAPGAMAPHPGGPPAALEERRLGAPVGEVRPGGPPAVLEERRFGAPAGEVRPGGPPAAMEERRPGGPVGAQFNYRGRTIERVHRDPFIYPQGWEYRRWEIGAALPPLFLAPDYYYPDWAALGLEPPPPGCQWLRYGPDLLLVDMNSGQILDTAYDVFY
jgi:Ni/Co efflux regulator RcnB